MNNIEIKKIKGLKPGMTDEEINALKQNRTKPVIKKNVEIIEKEEKILPSVGIIELPFNLSRLNLKKDVKDIRDYKLSSVNLGLPKRVSYKSQMSSVKDQGNLGSCVGFATVAMKEWQEQQEQNKEVSTGKKYKRKKSEYDLSEQWVYYKCKEIDPWPDEEGTSIKCAMQVLKRIGVPCEEAYPYNDQYKGKPEKWAKLVSKWGLIDSYWSFDSLSGLKTALAKNGPVVMGIACFYEILFPQKGYIPYPSNPNECYGGHAVCAVGYNDNKGIVEFKNSWGTEWGNKGYGSIPYKYIKDFMWGGWVAKDISVTKKILNDNINNEL